MRQRTACEYKFPLKLWICTSSFRLRLVRLTDQGQLTTGDCCNKEKYVRIYVYTENLTNMDWFKINFIMKAMYKEVSVPLLLNIRDNLAYTTLSSIALGQYVAPGLSPERGTLHSHLRFLKETALLLFRMDVYPYLWCVSFQREHSRCICVDQMGLYSTARKSSVR